MDLSRQGSCRLTAYSFTPLCTSQLTEATKPSGIKHTADGAIQFVRTVSPEEILQRAKEKQSLMRSEVKAFLDLAHQELGVLSNIPISVRFSLETGESASNKRKKQLNEILENLGFNNIQVDNEDFSADEVWDAVNFAIRFGTQNNHLHTFLELLEGQRWDRIRKHSDEILHTIGNEKISLVSSLAKCLIAEEIEPISLTSVELLQPHKRSPIQLHQKQIITNCSEAVVRDVLVVRKKLEMWEVVDEFLDQALLFYNKKERHLVVEGVSWEGSPEFLNMSDLVNVLMEIDAMKEYHQIDQEIRGFYGWTLEGVKRWEEIHGS